MHALTGYLWAIGLVFSETAEFGLEVVDLTAHIGDWIGGCLSRWVFGCGCFGDRVVVDFDPARRWGASGCRWRGGGGFRVLGVGFFLGFLDEVIYEAFGFFCGHFASIDKFIS